MLNIGFSLLSFQELARVLRHFTVAENKGKIPFIVPYSNYLIITSI